ncbi:UNVERIFIED_CONTAM: hypothetical protein HDU68_004902 [Siphonaria sp. JEL0065]|nr:hypothetical protein HDU68_004902 [Siphonaria sp. JEL0065]
MDPVAIKIDNSLDIEDVSDPRDSTGTLVPDIVSKDSCELKQKDSVVETGQSGTVKLWPPTLLKREAMPDWYQKK